MSNFGFMSLAGAYLLIIVLAVMVVSNRHQARQLFLNFQKLEKERDQLGANWSRLTLEQSTRLNQVRVEVRAKKELGMRKPPVDSIRIIHE